jgi:LmbE family N-acetylglucosaminyl deacetylase
MNIILSPHFDDAVLSLGGFLAKEGGNTLVATFFAGAPEPPLVRSRDTRCGFTDSNDAIQGRTKEDKESLNFLGVKDDRIYNYRHIDAVYRRQSKNDPDIPEPLIEAAIAKDIASLLQAYAAQPLNLYIPGFGMHVDHKLVKNAALTVIKNLPSGSAVKIFFYQDLPYAVNLLETESPRSVWEFITRSKPKKWKYSLLERKVTNGAFTVSPNIVPLTKEEMQKKLAGIALYNSQVNILGEGLLENIEHFGAAQAQHLNAGAPYCEVVYQLTSLYAAK